MPEGLLGKTLKKADQLARQQELEEAVDSIAQTRFRKSIQFQCKTKSMSIQSQTQSCLHHRKLPPKMWRTAAWQAQADIYGESGAAEQKKDATEAPKMMDISAWFDAARFLNDLKPYINKMFGRRFLAFSMPDGHGLLSGQGP